MTALLKKISNFFFSPVFLARVFFVLISTLCGSLLAEPNVLISEQAHFLFTQRALYSVIACFIALLVMTVEFATDAISSHRILMAAIGATVGLGFAHLFAPTIPASLVDPGNARMASNLLFGYFGIVLAFKHSERFHLSRLRALLTSPANRPKVLDSSVIIDGRVKQLIDMGVIAGEILVPNFVLIEIQNIADSNDPNRKARGRRGLEILQDLRSTCKNLDLLDNDYPDRPEVDQKLVLLCREVDGDLVTNDFNLQKIAQLHGIQVVNINEIANALKPAVYVGDELDLYLVREGKEHGQGIGYLEDGTMVVVDHAIDYLHEHAIVEVSSILQTSSGRMVFARIADHEHSNHSYEEHRGTTQISSSSHE